MSISMGGMGGINMPQAMTGASMRMPPAQKMTALFDRIDTNGQGSINKQQLAQAFQQMNPPRPFQQAGLEHVWGQLDQKNSGTVSKQEFVSGMTTMMTQLRQQPSMAESAANMQNSTQTIKSSMDALNNIGTIINKTA
ncbi:EF-hand domain-containing protein [Mariprofundus erugo]|uniref:EF-hand domain-containing protein n=1 Tax=Mariprofundus erugo TaxID=2528639 RepID=A0A5R9GJD4_9PROT|nr:EF-hand domain-containing protein [Mariprofundus erugo]TLS66320.1 EF-hand domain-containing protein [Mariprofundus erugo]TLS78192.1 EF-hand domain-containing protein [Mariprofundus erugo]